MAFKSKKQLYTALVYAKYHGTQYSHTIYREHKYGRQKKVKATALAVAFSFKKMFVTLG